MAIFNNVYTFFGTLIFANLLMYLLTILISYTWSKINQFQTLAITKKDVQISIAVLITNILVAIPGYLLFINNNITFTENEHFLLHFLLLYFGFDLVMYVSHFMSHHMWPFKSLHKTHHTHHYFNAISLYVMQPAEVLLFGLTLTICTFVFTINIYSFLFFLFANWLLGVIAHLNNHSKKQGRFFCNHVFHKLHHENGYCNYGFFTVFWDQLFGTIYSEK